MDEPGAGDEEPAGEPAPAGFVEEVAAALLRGPDVVAHAARRHVLDPAWRTVSEAESRWPVVVAVLSAVALQVTLPDRFAVHPRWLLPAFSPTDVLPLSRWAKLAMMLQSALSLSVVGLVVARAVNILS